MKLALKKPVQNGTETITELNMREEMVAGDLRGVTVKAEMTYDDLLKIAGRLCAQPDHVMAALSMPDMFAAIGHVAPLLAGGHDSGSAH